MLLTVLLHLGLPSLLLYKTQDHLPMDDTAHSDLDPFKLVITQEKCYMDLLTGQFDAGISSAEVSSSQMTLGLYRTGTNHLTKRRFFK